MLEYIKKKLQKYEHIWKGSPHDIPYPDHIKKYGKAAQEPISEDTTK